MQLYKGKPGMSINTLEDLNATIVGLQLSIKEASDSWYELFLKNRNINDQLANECYDKYMYFLGKLGNIELISTDLFAIVPKNLDTKLFGSKASNLVKWYRNTAKPTVADLKGFWRLTLNEDLSPNILAILKPLIIPSMTIPPNMLSSMVYVMYVESIGEVIHAK